MPLYDEFFVLFLEHEIIWQEILAERRRRKAVTPLVLYCNEEIQQKNSSLQEKMLKWPGIEEVLVTYHSYAKGMFCTR